MNTVKLSGDVDENGRLSVHVPVSICPGPVTVLVFPVSQEDDAAQSGRRALLFSRETS